GAAFDEQRAKDIIERYLDIGSSATLSPSDTIIAGRWFERGANHGAQLSVAEGSAKLLGLKLGDHLALDVGGRQISAEVTSLRKVDWRSRRIAFSFLLDPDSARDLPATYITSMYVPPSADALLDRVVQDYPNLTVFNSGAMFAHLQRVLDQVAAAIEFLFLFTLAAGVLVLYITLAASLDERQRQAAILRALGASRRQLVRAQVIECALTGALAGVLAAGGASVAAWALARFALRLEWHFSPLLWLAGLLAGALCSLLGGWAGLRTVLHQAPLQILRSL
ncbi:MAG: ABC transporter permease, partial [Massilia sp.]